MLKFLKFCIVFFIMFGFSLLISGAQAAEERALFNLASDILIPGSILTIFCQEDKEDGIGRCMDTIIFHSGTKQMILEEI